MRTLTAATLTELGLTVTRPGYLVQIGYATPLYLSTLGDISWASQNWSATDVRVQGINLDGSAGANATLTLGNTDGGFGALVLGEGACDIATRIWAAYAGATASGDPALVFEGVTNGADLDVKNARITMPLVSENNSTLDSPRLVIGKASGFNFMQSAGTRIAFNGESFVLERK